jgi:hypothetical protein
MLMLIILLLILLLAYALNFTLALDRARQLLLLLFLVYCFSRCFNCCQAYCSALSIEGVVPVPTVPLSLYSVKTLAAVTLAFTVLSTVRKPHSLSPSLQSPPFVAMRSPPYMIRRIQHCYSKSYHNQHPTETDNIHAIQNHSDPQRTHDVHYHWLNSRLDFDKMPRQARAGDNWGLARHRQGWADLNETLRTIIRRDRRAGRLAGEVLEDLSKHGGVSIHGENHARGGIGAHVRDVQELAGINDGDDPDIVEAVDKCKDILNRHQPPRYISSLGYHNWALNVGLGYNKPPAHSLPPWLTLQSKSFEYLVTELDRMAIGRARPDIAKEEIALVAEDLTKPGGAVLHGLPLYNNEGRPRQASVGGPGAHPEDVRAMIPTIIRESSTIYPLYQAYRVALKHRDMPYKISMSSPGLIAVQEWEWLRDLEPAFQRLLVALRAYAPGIRVPRIERERLIERAQDLLATLEGEGGVILSGGHRLKYGGPGISPRDLKDDLDEGGYMASKTWYPAARDYIRFTQLHWRNIPRDIRRTGSCPHKDSNYVT